MRYALYVCLQDDGKIACFAMNADSGQLTPRAEVGGSGRAVARRLASYHIDGEDGALTPLATLAIGQRPAAVLATRLGD
jgi:6-phosphogluconolactonase (cycloisomerase 2 family)